MALITSILSITTMLTAEPRLVAIDELVDCAGREPLRGRHSERAIISHDGDQIALECASGDRFIWIEGSGTRGAQAATLFDLAKSQRLLPETLTCAHGRDVELSFPADCDVIDKRADLYLIKNNETNNSFVINAETSDIEAYLDFTNYTGAIVANRNNVQYLVYANHEDHPPTIRAVNLDDGDETDFAAYEYTETFLGPTTTAPQSFAWSESGSILVVGFSGPVRNSSSVVVLAGYDVMGQRIWTREQQIENLGVTPSGASRHVHRFGHPEFVLAQNRRDNFFELIRASTGETVLVQSGRIITASTGSSRLVYRTPEGGLVVADIR